MYKRAVYMLATKATGGPSILSAQSPAVYATFILGQTYPAKGNRVTKASRLEVHAPTAMNEEKFRIKNSYAARPSRLVSPWRNPNSAVARSRYANRK
jgi:hypothetical protein